jgi:ParB family chromosome partitioning protein
MREQGEQNGKKSRLGRGLGSLLSGAGGSVVPSQNEQEKPMVTATTGNSAVVATPVVAVSQKSAAEKSTVVVQTVPPEARVWKIAVDKLNPNEFQPRQFFNKETLQELANSIKDKGILQPIVARRHINGTFEIISGERRWRAAQMAGLHEVPVLIKAVSDQDSLELAIIENIQRENLNPIDEAEAFQRLISEFNLTQQQVAEKVAKDRATVANTLRLLLLAEPVRKMVSEGSLSTGHAKVILSLDETKDQVALAKKIIAEKLSVRATEKLAAKIKTGEDLNPSANSSNSEDQKTDIKIKAVENLSGELQKLIGTKVDINYQDGKGKISLVFYSDDELNQIVEKLRKAWQK